MIDEAPWLQAIYNKHISYYDELLPYIFMQEELPDKIKEICQETFIENKNVEQNKLNIIVLLKIIEDGIHEDCYEVRDLIIAFLKEINPRLEYFDFFREMTGYSTRAILEYLHRNYTIY